jgi:CheY-like chemotaxis protein
LASIVDALMDLPNVARRAILIVEDNAIVRGALAICLRKAGYAVATASDGREALDLLRGRPAPDLILLDMLMPVLDGWHFLAQLKQQTDLDGVRIVLTTGTILTPEWAHSHGCVGLLRKPVVEAELLGEVARCLAAG